MPVLKWLDVRPAFIGYFTIFAICSRPKKRLRDSMVLAHYDAVSYSWIFLNWNIQTMALL